MSAQMDVIDRIRAKKELRALPREFIQDVVERHALQTVDERTLIKGVRAKLRTCYGMFVLAPQKKEKVLQSYVQGKISRKDLDEKLLSLHCSSKERLPHYKEVYRQVWKHTGVPKRILDLGCGLNPCSYSLLGCTPQYEARELAEQDCSFLNAYFSATGISGTAVQTNVLKAPSMTGDVCFLFKMLDTLEGLERNCTARVLDCISAPWIIASFPTASLGGRKTIRSKHTWFERVLSHKHLSWKTVCVGTEVFYIIKS